MNWYDKYIGLPYKHLGEDPIEGIDCFNLCRYVYKQELKIDIPLGSHDFCNIVDDNWFQKTNTSFFDEGAKLVADKFGSFSVDKLAPFDIIFMSLGSTNVTNHCALYIGANKILQIMMGKPSWIGPYGKYYIQYTTGKYRWKNLNS